MKASVLIIVIWDYLERNMRVSKVDAKVSEVNIEIPESSKNKEVLKDNRETNNIWM